MAQVIPVLILALLIQAERSWKGFAKLLTTSPEEMQSSPTEEHSRNAGNWLGLALTYTSVLLALGVAEWLCIETARTGTAAEGEVEVIQFAVISGMVLLVVHPIQSLLLGPTTTALRHLISSRAHRWIGLKSFGQQILLPVMIYVIVILLSLREVQGR